MHLILDGEARNKSLLEKHEDLRDWLIRTARGIDMSPFGDVIIRDFPFPGSSSPALSAVCFLAESSIVIHTYPEYGFVFIDVFSCKDFDCDRLEGMICREFGITSPHVLQLQRGARNGDIIPVRLPE